MRRLLVPSVATLAVAGLVALLAYGLSARATSHTLDDAVARGQRPAAPQLSLPRLGAPGQRSLADYRGKVVVLNFWASWCDPCAAEAPLLQSAQRQLLEHNATVLGVTYRDASGDSQGFVRRFGLTYPSLRDIDGRLADAYATKALPETFVIDRGGRIAAISRGEISRAFLANAVALAERS